MHTDTRHRSEATLLKTRGASWSQSYLTESALYMKTPYFITGAIATKSRRCLPVESLDSAEWHKPTWKIDNGDDSLVHKN